MVRQWGLEGKREGIGNPPEADKSVLGNRESGTATAAFGTGAVPVPPLKLPTDRLY